MSRQLSSREEEFKQLRDAHSKLQKVRTVIFRIVLSTISADIKKKI